MKIGIIGCGAMGSVYAALLADAGNEVWAIDAWREHVDAIRANGLRLQGASGDRVVRIAATTDAAEAGECELVIVATKADGVASAARAAAGIAGPDSTILTIQNGLGAADRIAEAIDASKVLIGVVGGFGASIVAPGHAHHNGMQLVRIGEMGGGESARLRRVVDTWSRAGFTARGYPDIHKMIWEKFVCNVTYSGPCALTNLTIGQVQARPGGLGDRALLRPRGGRRGARQGDRARLRRRGRLCARFRRGDAGRAALHAARPPGRAAVRDRRDQRRGAGRGGEGGHGRAGQRDGLRPGAGQGGGVRGGSRLKPGGPAGPAR